MDINDIISDDVHIHVNRMSVIPGDIGHYDADGHFYVIDRLKELIKWKGLQVLTNIKQYPHSRDEGWSHSTKFPIFKVLKPIQVSAKTCPLTLETSPHSIISQQAHCLTTNKFFTCRL